MGGPQIAQLAGEALWLALVLIAPVVGATFVTSLVVGALQSVTQVHDTTLQWVPRLLAGLGTLWLTWSWMGERLIRFATDVLVALPSLV